MHCTSQSYVKTEFIAAATPLIKSDQQQLKSDNTTQSHCCRFPACNSWVDQREGSKDADGRVTWLRSRRGCLQAARHKLPCAGAQSCGVAQHGRSLHASAPVRRLPALARQQLRGLKRKALHAKPYCEIPCTLLTLESGFVRESCAASATSWKSGQALNINPTLLSNPR